MQEIYELRAATAECVNAGRVTEGFNGCPYEVWPRSEGARCSMRSPTNLMRTIRLAPSSEARLSGRKEAGSNVQNMPHGSDMHRSDPFR